VSALYLPAPFSRTTFSPSKLPAHGVRDSRRSLLTTLCIPLDAWPAPQARRAAVGASSSHRLLRQRCQPFTPKTAKLSCTVTPGAGRTVSPQHAVPQDAGPRKLLAPTQAPAPAGLAAVVNAAVLPIVNLDLTHGVTATAVAAATASAAIYAVLQVMPPTVVTHPESEFSAAGL